MRANCIKKSRRTFFPGDVKYPRSDRFGGASLIYDLEDETGRREAAAFHIERGDYFATLATIVKVAGEEKNPRRKNILSKLADDLLYLQSRYEIREKPARSILVDE